MAQWALQCLGSMRKQVESPAWYRGLRIPHCHHSRGLGPSCGLGLIPGLRSPRATRPERKKGGREGGWKEGRMQHQTRGRRGGKQSFNQEYQKANSNKQKNTKIKTDECGKELNRKTNPKRVSEKGLGRVLFSSQSNQEQLLRTQQAIGGVRKLQPQRQILQQF